MANTGKEYDISSYFTSYDKTIGLIVSFISKIKSLFAWKVVAQKIILLSVLQRKLCMDNSSLLGIIFILPVNIL